jgi:hypothetical protein
MFQDAALVAMFQPTNVRVITNLAIEAMVMHVRNLIDFFYNEDDARKSEYILAEHFFSSPESWRPYRSRSARLDWGTPPESPTISIAELSGLANVTATHLTWSRLDQDVTRWRFSSLLRHFDQLFRAFLAHVSPELVTLIEVEPQLLPPGDGNPLRLARYQTRSYAPLVRIEIERLDTHSRADENSRGSDETP